MSLFAGDLRWRIAIEAQQHAQDPLTGEIATTWTSVIAGAWGSIQPLSAREFIAGQQVQAQADTKIIIRWRDGIDASMRVRDLVGGALYNILGVLPDNVSGREWITLVCATGVTDGR